MALSLLQQVEATGQYIQNSAPRAFDRAAAVFGLAVLDSAGYIREELRVAMVRSTNLLAAIENARADKDHIFQYCPELRANTMSLDQSENALRAVIQDMFVLEGILESAPDWSSSGLDSPGSFLFIFPAVRTNGAALDAMLQSVQIARQAAAAMMKVGHGAA